MLETIKDRCESMKKKYTHAKTVGNQTESIASEWLSKYNCKQEDTMRNTRTRSKGSIDFEGDNIAIEVKHFTNNLTFKYKSEDHDIKWSQVEYLSKKALEGKVSGFLITEDNETFYFILIRSFMSNWTNRTRKSINNHIANEIGVKCTSKEELDIIIEGLL